MDLQNVGFCLPQCVEISPYRLFENHDLLANVSRFQVPLYPTKDSNIRFSGKI
jgi:hypothetical protein